MRPVDVGRLLFSAWEDILLQQRHCRTKDWPYSQAAATTLTITVPWTFSMRRLDVGRLLLSAREEEWILQRRHCRTKDWPYSQAAVRLLICFELLILQDGVVIWECVGHVLRVRGRFELLGMKADALRLSRYSCF